MSLLVLMFGCLAVGLFVSQRLVWIAGTRLGWLFYLANVVGELGPKRLNLSRDVLDGGIAILGLSLLAFAGIGWPTLSGLATLLLALVVILQGSERHLLDTVWLSEDGIGPLASGEAATRGLASGYPSPSTHPQLTINIEGPFVRRWPRPSLGTLVVGREFSVGILVANHSLAPTQTPVRLVVSAPSCLAVAGAEELLVPPIAPGCIERVVIGFKVTGVGKSSRIKLKAEWGEAGWKEDLAVDRFVGGIPKIVGAELARYPGARRAAFAWRGDMDLYDTSTLQSIEGLEHTFGLAARYRMPQTMYLSTRLSLDEKVAAEWAAHYGVDRGAETIPAFVEWMRSKVELRHRAGYPFDSRKPYLIELGNHGHLHYGTDASAAEENSWNTRARMGDGRYAWALEAKDSFEEQRDNAIEARRWIEELFGFSVKSWAMPDRTRDEQTPRAMEAAGCEVLSDSDVRTHHNVLLQPRPHFAPGSGAVELTKRYPGDPLNILHYWMNLFWLHRAHRLGIPNIFMCHQHMRLYEGWACTRFTEAVLRYVLGRFHGDFWINTVYGIGVYWRDLLSEKRACNVAVTNGEAVVDYRGPLTHSAVPLDLALAGGGRTTVLVDLEPGARIRIDARGTVA